LWLQEHLLLHLLLLLLLQPVQLETVLLED
jgi:hypothetical protein